MSGDLFSNIQHEFDPYAKYENIKEISLSELLSLEKNHWDITYQGIQLMQLKNK